MSAAEEETLWQPVRIAMWSGPRNISTAMMRAWGNRRDTVVVDEPFYPFFLHRTGLPHPGAAEVIAQGTTDWRKVVTQLSGAVPDGKRIFYQKQMTHHLLPEIELGWLGTVRNCFLIRDPAEVIASYLRKRAEPALGDLGFVQQEEIFDFVRAETRRVPPVVDARDVQARPRETLQLLCDALQVPFSEAMLRWAPGRRNTDGVWAKHWYGEVEQSTGFQPPRTEPAHVPPHLQQVHDRCRAIYERLWQHRLH